jgi:hypothetical protein
MSPNAWGAPGGGGGSCWSQPMSTAVHRSPNKLQRSNSIFNLRVAQCRSFLHVYLGFTVKHSSCSLLRSSPIIADAARRTNHLVTPHPFVILIIYAFYLNRTYYPGTKTGTITPLPRESADSVPRGYHFRFRILC